MDQKVIDEINYLPANHAFTSFIIGGVEQVRSDAAEKIAEVNAATDMPDDEREWAVWYDTTINGIADKLEKKDQSWKEYSPFEPKENNVPN